MKKIVVAALCLVAVVGMGSFSNKKKAKVLIFSKTAGYHHAAIPIGIAAIEKIGASNNFTVDTTTDSTRFTYKNLKQYAAVIFLNTTGNVLNGEGQDALVRYMHKGGSFVGVHSATDTEYDWPWYGKMIGAYFASHPAQQEAKLHVVDATHPSTKDVPMLWTRFDEWYNYKNMNPDVHILLQLDETTYTGGKNGSNHPISWWQNFEGGYVFYTGLGHTEISYTDSLYLKHLTGGILAAIYKQR